MRKNIAIIRTRGKITESHHYANIAVIDQSKKIIASFGDPHYFTYLRSSAKPIQALQIILSGAADAFNLSPNEIALACASHYGENEHINTVLSMMKKASISLTDFLCGTATSLNTQYAFELARNGVQDSELISDCSGKHAGMLAICKYKGYPLKTYLDINHPLQQENLKLIAQFCETDPNNIAIGIDGCSVPVFAVSLYQMATAYLNLVNPVSFEADVQNACDRIFNAMNQHPFMISGSKGFCTALIKATNGRLVGKIGAEGVYCIGLKKEKLAIAIKVEDGSLSVIPTITLHVLKELNLLSHQELYALSEFDQPDILNDNGITVGKIIANFKLKYEI